MAGDSKNIISGNISGKGDISGGKIGAVLSGAASGKWFLLAPGFVKKSVSNENN